VPPVWYNMTRCPRCDKEVNELHPIPAEALADPAGGEANAMGTDGRPEACRWCVNEISEG